jgi:hypothetical protein
MSGACTAADYQAATACTGVAGKKAGRRKDLAVAAPAGPETPP